MSRHENQHRIRLHNLADPVRRTDYELDYLSNLMGVSRSLVEEAMASAGTTRRSVIEYIEKHRSKNKGRTQ